MKHPRDDASVERLVRAADAMGVHVDTDAARDLVELLRRMQSEPQNLTAVSDEAEGVDRHLADSLAALTLELPEGPVADIGSGGGMPGLVLARMLPQRDVTLIESERRKAEWLARASAQMPRVRVCAERTEEVATREREGFAVVTARAVAPPSSTLELAAPLVAVGGMLVAWTGTDSGGEWAGLAPVARHLGFDDGCARIVTPFPHARRMLMVFRKHSAAPAAYPRRPGRATKRPLDAAKVPDA